MNRIYLVGNKVVGRKFLSKLGEKRKIDRTPQQSLTLYLKKSFCFLLTRHSVLQTRQIDNCIAAA